VWKQVWYNVERHDSLCISAASVSPVLVFDISVFFFGALKPEMWVWLYDPLTGMKA